MWNNLEGLHGLQNSFSFIYFINHANIYMCICRIPIRASYSTLFMLMQLSLIFLGILQLPIELKANMQWTIGYGWFGQIDTKLVIVVLIVTAPLNNAHKVHPPQRPQVTPFLENQSLITPKHLLQLFLQFWVFMI